MPSVSIDNIIKGNLVMHTHKSTDIVDAPTNTFVNITGDTMTGNLTMGTNWVILEDSGGTEWKITVNTDGALITSEVSTVIEYLLLETGDFLLQEDGSSKIILE